MTLSYEKATGRETPIGSPVSVITWSFTSDASGTASEESEKVSGIVQRVVINPDDTAPPTASWDLTIEDEDGVDILSGLGQDRDPYGRGASEQIPLDFELAVSSKLTFKVANAGASKKATVKLFLV